MISSINGGSGIKSATTNDAAKKDRKIGSCRIYLKQRDLSKRAIILQVRSSELNSA